MNKLAYYNFFNIPIFIKIINPKRWAEYKKDTLKTGKTKLTTELSIKLKTTWEITTKFTKTFNILKNSKNYKSINKDQVQDNIIVSVVLDILKVKRLSMSINLLRNIKEWQKECCKNHTPMNKLMKQGNDYLFLFFYCLSLIKYKSHDTKYQIQRKNKEWSMMIKWVT